VDSFDRVDAETVARARRIEVQSDPALAESEFVLNSGDKELVRVEAALGSPQRPLDAAALRAKVEGLGGSALPAALDDHERPAAGVLEAAGLLL
jgi:hypothetical protein